MADNVAYTPGSGATIAADDVGGVLVQRVKLTAGADGTATDLLGDATNGLDVDITRMPDATTASGTLGALNATVSVAMRGHAGASVQIVPTSAALELSAHTSHDGGTTWALTYMWEAARGVFFNVVNPSGTAAYSIAVPSGATHVRVKVVGYTSGSVAAVLSAAEAPALPLPIAQLGGTTDALSMAVVVAGLDGSAAVQQLRTTDTAPSGSEQGLITRVVGSVAVTDNGGNLSVDDGGGSLTVDGTVAVSGTVTVGSHGVTDNGGTLTVDAPVGTPVFVRLSDGSAAITTLPVSGPLTDTQLRATALPVSGPLTDTQLRATALPVSNTNLDVALSTRLKPADTLAGVTTVAAVTAITNALPAGSNAIGSVGVNVGGSAVSASNPVPVVSVSAGTITYKGRVSTFRTPGRAGTAGQKLFALHNATGSTKVVTLNLIAVDITCTVIKAVTVLPPTIRCCRFTAVPTNGTTLTKVARDTALSSNASVTAWGDASADGTGSGTTLTIGAIAVNTSTSLALTQEFAPRLITAAGYEMFDRTEFFGSSPVTLRALEGVAVFLDYTLATQNPATDMWTVTCEWDES